MRSGLSTISITTGRFSESPSILGAWTWPEAPYPMIPRRTVVPASPRFRAFSTMTSYNGLPRYLSSVFAKTRKSTPLKAFPTAYPFLIDRYPSFSMPFSSVSVAGWGLISGSRCFGRKANPAMSVGTTALAMTTATKNEYWPCVTMLWERP